MKDEVLGSLGILLLLAIGITLIPGFRGFDEKTPWNVPEAAKAKKNPVAADATSIAAGKSLWATHCKSCHGAKGLGDGPKAAQLKTEPGDFSKAEAQSQSDGTLFFKTSEGHGDMPSFKKKMPDEEDIWNVINFVRTLKK